MTISHTHVLETKYFIILYIYIWFLCDHPVRVVPKRTVNYWWLTFRHHEWRSLSEASEQCLSLDCFTDWCSTPTGWGHQQSTISLFLNANKATVKTYWQAVLPKYIICCRLACLQDSLQQAVLGLLCFNTLPVDLLGSYGQLISVMYPSDFHLGPRNLKMIDGHKIIRLRK